MIQQPEVEETPTRLPGECFSCAATQLSPGRDWFLDTDVDYFDTPMYRIQICNICFDILANKCGYIKIGEEVAQYKRAIAERDGRINELDNYRRYIDFLGIDIGRLDRIMGFNPGNLKQNLQTLANLAQRSEAERIRIQDQWAAERQDFLNRLMTKEWTSYAQLTNPGSISTSETLTPDEDRGVGEVLIDYD